MAPTIAALFQRAARPGPRDTSDADLLNRIAADRQSEALAELVRRHAGLVWGVCRRTLRQPQDAEDAFQATFLALVRQANRLDGRGALAGWLHTVATRVARKARARDAKRGPVLDTADRPAGDAPAAETSDLLAAVDREIARLPLRLRAPVVLCCLEGLTRDEAAERIGCSTAAVKARLERGRRLLRKALVRRGIELPAVFIVVGLGVGRVPAAVRDRAVTAVLGTPSPAVTSLAATGPSFLKPVLILAIGATAVFGIAFGQKAPDPAPMKAAPRQVVEARLDAIGDTVPEAALLRLGTTRFRHPGNAGALVVTPDGQRVVTLGYEGLHAWDVATGKELWRSSGKRDLFGDLNVHVGERPLVMHPDGKRVITRIDGPGFHLWDLDTGKATRVQVGADDAKLVDQKRTVDVSPDGKTVALGGPRGVLFCDLDGQVLGQLANPPGQPLGNPNVDRLLAARPWSYPKFAPDGKTLAVAMSVSPETVRICKLDGSDVGQIPLAKRFLDCAFSPDGTLLAVAERDDAVRVYDVKSGERKHEWKVTIKGANENYLFAVAFAPDGKTVFAPASDKLIHRWDVATGKALDPLRGHGWYPWALGFGPGGKVVYSTGWDGDIRRWDPATGKQLPLPQGVRGSSTVAAAPDGTSLVYVDGEGAFRFVDPKTGVEQRTITVPGLGTTELAFSREAKSLAFGGSTGDQVTVGVLDLATGAVTKRWDWPKGRDPHAAPVALAWSADGSRLGAMVFRQQSARVFDVKAGGDPLVLPHKEGYGLSFHPDGKTLVTAGWDKMIRVWRVPDGKQAKELAVALPPGTPPGQFNERSDTRLMAITYSPDGSRLAGFTLGHDLWVWDTATMKLVSLTPTGVIPRVNTLAYSPDGVWLTLGGAPGGVKLFDAVTGQLVWDRGRHGADVYTVSFGKDAKTLLTGAGDGLGYLWDLRPKLVATDTPPELWPALIGADGPAAYRAYWGMLNQPDAAVAEIAVRGKERFAKADPAQVQKWIADLDSSRFAVREAALSGLTKHLWAAVPQMKEALAGKLSAEQRERLKKLLAEWDVARTHWNRAVGVLTTIDTPAARDVLKDWAR
ncbi:MAG TPA: sigma-70 family RNA polymerase sigma factor [Gemmataceae bacterium]|nr:sigma-70 family RNA polymerase sigma factor [Gemmataceae bacterium]